MARLNDDLSSYGPLEALIGSWGLYERFNGREYVTLSVWEQFIRHSGLEITALELVSVRVGRHYQHPFNGNFTYNSLGFGIQYKFFSFDYATIFRPDDDNLALDGTDYIQLKVHLPFDVFPSPSAILKR